MHWLITTGPKDAIWFLMADMTFTQDKFLIYKIPNIDSALAALSNLLTMQATGSFSNPPSYTIICVKEGST